MKTSILTRCFALIGAAAVTFLLVQSLANYGLPVETAPQMARAAVTLVPR